MGDIPIPLLFCGSNVLFFGHPAGWLGLGKSKTRSPEELWVPGGGLSAPTGVWAVKALQRNVKDEQRHLLWHMLCRNGRLQVSVTLDFNCSRQLKWESHRKPGGNLCFSDTVTHSLQMRQQQARVDTCRCLIAYLLWYPCPSQISTHSFSQYSPRTRSASGHYCGTRGTVVNQIKPLL